MIRRSCRSSIKPWPRGLAGCVLLILSMLASCGGSPTPTGVAAISSPTAVASPTALVSPTPSNTRQPSPDGRHADRCPEPNWTDPDALANPASNCATYADIYAHADAVAHAPGAGAYPAADADHHGYGAAVGYANACLQSNTGAHGGFR